MKTYASYLAIMLLSAFALPCSAQFTTEQKLDSTNANDIQEQRMELMVTDFKTKKLIEADVMIKGLNPRKTVVFKELSDSTLMLKKYRLYTVSVIKEGYMYFAHKFWPDESAVHYERIELKPLSMGLKTSIEDITFRGDETEIFIKSVPALEELITFLTLNPTVKICVIGHVNGPVNAEHRNSDSFYRKASEKRAEAVKDYLVQHAIKEDRLTFKGMGNKQMIYPDPQTEWQVGANRRIEVEIVGL